MMGSSPPSQSTLSDLKVLLELLQAASDPKQAKKVIDSIADARKQYDDAIAESNERLKSALAAQNKAEAAASKAEKAEEKLESQKAALEARSVEVSLQAAALAEDKKALEVRRSEIQTQAQALVAERDQMNAGATAQRSKIAEDRAAFKAEVAVFDAEVQKVKDMKAEYEEKLAKIKALTA